MARSPWLLSLLPVALAACGGNTAVTTDNVGPGGANSTADTAGTAGTAGSKGGNAGSSGSDAGNAGNAGSSGASSGGTGGTGGTGVAGMPSSSSFDSLFGSEGDDAARGVAVDSGGNAVVAGTYEGTMDAGGTALTSALVDIFLTKVDTNGKVQWAKSFGTAQNDRAINVSINEQGQIFIAGSFGDLGGSFGGNPYNGTGPVFGKLAPDGTNLWNKAWILNGMGNWGGIVADPDGTCWVTGVFNGSINFGGGKITSVGTLDPFIAHLDVNGGQLSLVTWPGNVTLRGQAADGKGNLFIVGSFKGTLDLGTGALTSADPMVNDSFMALIGANGKAIWAKKVPGTVQRVTVDSSGNEIVTGFFIGQADFGTGSMTSAGGEDIFVLKADSGGKTLWAKKFGSTSSDRGHEVDTDAMGNVYLSGYFSGAPDFGMGPQVVGMGHNVLVMKLSPEGDVIGTKGFGGDGNEEALYIAVDTLGFAFAWGELDAPGNYGSGLKTPVGKKDVFLVKAGF